MKATCPKCGYFWQRRSKMAFAQCPNCRKIFKVKVEKSGA